MSEHTTKELIQALYDVLPADNSAITNEKARTLLSKSIEQNVPKPAYDAIRSAAQDQGLVRCRAGGPAGVIGREERSGAAPVEATSDERSLYQPTMEFVRTKFRDHLDLSGRRFIVEDTSTGGRATGTWKRPDVTMIDARFFKYLNQTMIDIYSFEVKTFQSFDLKAIYEAHEQGQQTHYPYAVWFIPADAVHNIDKPKLAQLVDAAQRTAVGFIMMHYTQSPEKIHVVGYDMVASPSKRSPKAEVIERFIDDRITDKKRRAEILSWHKEIE